MLGLISEADLMSSFFTYLQTNKEWLFSGLGIAIAVGVFQLISWSIKRRRLRRKAPQTLVFDQQPGVSPTRQVAEKSKLITGKPAKTKRISDLTPAGIRETLAGMPPLQASEMMKQMTGLDVEWEAKLFSAEPLADGKQVRVALTTDPHQLILCVVDLDKNRELVVRHKDAPVTVIGTIASVNPTMIQLRDVQLLFHG